MKVRKTTIQVSYEPDEEEKSILVEKLGMDKFQALHLNLRTEFDGELLGITSGNIEVKLNDITHIKPVEKTLRRWVYHVLYNK